MAMIQLIKLTIRGWVLGIKGPRKRKMNLSVFGIVTHCGAMQVMRGSGRLHVNGLTVKAPADRSIGQKMRDVGARCRGGFIDGIAQRNLLMAVIIRQGDRAQDRIGQSGGFQMRIGVVFGL
tara:strand:- start:38 stop:400 length:363 start_codon:yes stop_codon:yes gene_type:complete